MSNRFVYRNGKIVDLQSDWYISVNEGYDYRQLCKMLNSLDDEKWEYKSKYNKARTLLFKINKLSSES